MLNKLSLFSCQRWGLGTNNPNVMLMAHDDRSVTEFRLDNNGLNGSKKLIFEVYSTLKEKQNRKRDELQLCGNVKSLQSSSCGQAMLQIL